MELVVSLLVLVFTKGFQISDILFSFRCPLIGDKLFAPNIINNRITIRALGTAGKCICPRDSIKRR